MTALTQYERLEATGLWRAASGAQRREVVVSLGDATLVISTLSEAPLAHWSLPAIVRLNPGEAPALYAPDNAAGGEPDEVLEVSEPDMIAALDRVRRAIDRRRPHRGRVRLLIGSALAGAAALLTVFWLPGATVRHAASVLPEASRSQIGDRLLEQIETLTGAPCATGAGLRAMAALSGRLFGGDAPRIVVLHSGAVRTAHLPGNTLVVHRNLVETHEDPAVLAGYLLAQDVRRQGRDPVRDLLERAGPIAAGRLLLTGEVPAEVLRAHVAALLPAPPRAVDDEALLARFAAAEVPSAPYAYARDITGETTLSLIEADPYRDTEAPPLLSDGAWVQLQQICGG